MENGLADIDQYLHLSVPIGCLTCFFLLSEQLYIEKSMHFFIRKFQMNLLFENHHDSYLMLNMLRISLDFLSKVLFDFGIRLLFKRFIT